MSENGDLLGKIVSEWARAEIQKKDILNYNGALLSYTDKARIANLLGLTDQQKLGVTPFPSPTTVAIGGSSDSSSNSDLLSRLEKLAAPAATKQNDWWKYLLVALASIGTTIGGVALNNGGSQDPVAQTQSAVSLDMEGFPLSQEKSNE